MADWVVAASAEGNAIPPELLEELEDVARLVLESEEAGEAELSIALVSDDTISALNLQYLGHEGPTDVISFPLEDARGRVVGDIYVGYSQARRQADELGLPYREELIRMVVHGTLHILGWDHGEDSDGEMYTLQEQLMERILGSRES